MGDMILTILTVFAVIFVVCSLVGIFRARADIRKNKNDDNFFRPTRKETIKHKMDMGVNCPADVFAAVNSLSADEKAEFQRQLLAKFNQE